MARDGRQPLASNERLDRGPSVDFRRTSLLREETDLGK